MQAQSLGRKDPLEEGMQLTPVFLPGGSHGQRSLAGCSPWVTRVGHDWATEPPAPPRFMPNARES